MKTYLFLILGLFSFSAISQTGPGGVGTSANNSTWLDASTLTLSNGSVVTTWNDISGNNNNLQQPSGVNQPTFVTSAINGFPSVEFDGVNDYMDFETEISNSGISSFVIYKSTNTGNGIVYGVDNHILFAKGNAAFMYYVSPDQFPAISKTANQFSLLSSRTGGALNNVPLELSNNAINKQTVTRNTVFTALDTSSVGMSKAAGVYSNPMQGEISEMIIFNEEIRDIDVSIVNIYLGTKYDLPFGSAVYQHRATHHFGLIGVGREGGEEIISARGRGQLSITNPTGLNSNFEYLTIAHDNGGFTPSTSVPSGIKERWTQTWRVGKFRTPGDIDLEFFLDGNALTGSTSDYVLLIDDDGDFTNGGTTQNTSGTFNVGNQSVSFSGIDFTDGQHFTLAIEDNTINAIASGNWNSTSTWDCTCIPNEVSTAEIGSPFNVTINANSRIEVLTIATGGTLTFGSDDTLDIESHLVLDGTLTMNQMGTIAATGVSPQNINNTSNVLTDINNLFVNNTAGVNIQSGPWSISNDLQVSAGNLNVTGTDSLVLLSDASKTSQILQSVDNAFTGTFKVERFIDTRNANFANISSTVESTTVADLDDDLFLSGVSGNNGNAASSSGGTFFSLYSYDRPGDSHVAITSTATSLTPGEGYEVYLATTANSYTQGGFSLEGVPNTGDVTATIDQGFNLVGNPYHSFIDFDATDKSNIDDVYYIFDANTGSYRTENAVSKPAIASGQGFWINKSTAGSVSYTLQEGHKVDNNSSSFVRKKKRNLFTLQLKDSENLDRHSLSIELNPHALNTLDPKDIKHLPSPFDNVPQITTKAENSNQKLVNNSLNSFEEVQNIPINIKASKGENLKIVTENFDAIYDNYSCAYLKDNSTGTIFDITIENEIEFSADDNENRFKLVLSNSYDDCQKELEDNTTNQKIDQSLSLRNMNGDWYLNFNLSDEVQNLTISLYNMNGQLVSENKTITVSGEGNFILNNLSPTQGIYLIQVRGKDLFLNKSIKF